MPYQSLGITKIDGLQQVFANLEGLPENVVLRIERGGLKKALIPVKATADANMPENKDQSSIAWKAKKGYKRLRDYPNEIVTKRKGGLLYGSVQNKAPHAHLLEKGHRMVSHAGKVIKEHVPGHPFLFPALVQNKDLVLSILAAEIDRAIQAYAAKQAKATLKAERAAVNASAGWV